LLLVAVEVNTEAVVQVVFFKVTLVLLLVVLTL
jgi:hypothetical protein